MTTPKQWRQKRIKKFKAPSGDQYVLRIPDPISLIQAWKRAGVKTPLDQKDLGEKVTQPDVVAKILTEYILEPKITPKPTAKTLGINELMEDQTDCIAIYREIMSAFIDRPDEVAEFFRGLGFSPEGGSGGAVL